MYRLLFPRRLIQWLGPLLALGAAAVLIGVIVVTSGVVELSAAKPHPEGWARFLHFTFERSTAYHATAAPPPDLDDPIRIAAGAGYYGQVCARCHGGPGFGQNPVVLSMHPKPQYLPSDLPVAKYTAPELFRIVKAGVKYSAMPSWPVDGRDDEVWQIVAFLRAMPSMSPATFQRLALPATWGPGGGANTAPFGALPVAQHPYGLRNDGEPPVDVQSYRSPVFGFTGFAQTADPVATCTVCHGADGAGRGAFPNLTIQTRDYTARTLAAFAAGRRNSAFMQVMASELSPAQIVAIADHYATLPRRSAMPGRPFPALGQQVALKGLPAKGVAPCASCHGVDKAADLAFPSLEGQQPWYLANQMDVFRAGGRGTIAGNKQIDPMIAIAQRLSQAEIQAVAAYYAAQPPATVQSFAGIGGRPG